MRSVEDELLTTAEVAALLGRSVPTINRWAVEERLIPVMKVPGLRGPRLYRRADVEALAATNSG